MACRRPASCWRPTARISRYFAAPSLHRATADLEDLVRRGHGDYTAQVYQIAMNPSAIVKAKSRFRVAKKAIDELVGCLRYEHVTDCWYSFLTGFHGVYTICLKKARKLPRDPGSGLAGRHAKDVKILCFSTFFKPGMMMNIASVSVLSM